MRRYCVILFCAIAAAFLRPGVACACAVCGGNPDSKMVKGAEAGVLLLVVVTYALLLAFAGMTAFWFVRARRMARLRPPR